MAWKKLCEIEDKKWRGAELLKALKKESDFFEDITTEELEKFIKDGWITFEEKKIIVWVDGE